MAKENCVIVGAGYGAIAAGALLAKNGFEALMLEAQSVIGGRAQCEEFMGFWLDHAIHFAVEHEVKAAVQVCAAAGIKLDYYVSPVWGSVLKDGKQTRADEIYPGSPLYKRESIKRVYHYLSDDDVSQLENLFKVGFEEYNKLVKDVITPRGLDFSKFPQVTFKEWLISKGVKRQTIFDYFMSALYTFTALPEEAQLEHPIYFMFSRLAYFCKSGEFRITYPINDQYGGLAADHYPLFNVFKNNGGRLELNTRVKKVHIENNQVKGVTTEHNGTEKFIETDKVIIDIPPFEAFKYGVLPKEAFSPDFVKNVFKLDEEDDRVYPYQFTTVHFLLRKKVADIVGVLSNMLDKDGRPLCYVTPVSDYAPTTAPYGKQLLQFLVCLDEHKYPANGTSLQYVINEKVLKPAIEMWGKEFENNIEYMVAYNRPYIWDQYAATDVRAPLVPAKSEIQGLYFVGAFAEGTQQWRGRAYATGLFCAEEILGRKLSEDISRSSFSVAL